MTGDYSYHDQLPVLILAFTHNHFLHEWLTYSSRETELVRNLSSLVRNQTCDSLLAWLTREPLGYTGYKLSIAFFPSKAPLFSEKLFFGFLGNSKKKNTRPHHSNEAETNSAQSSFVKNSYIEVSWQKTGLFVCFDSG